MKVILILLLAPVGGGGLLSGTALASIIFLLRLKLLLQNLNRPMMPGYHSPKRNLCHPGIPNTIADGLRTSLGSFTFPIILHYVETIITVSEESIIQAMRLVLERMKILIETSSAVPVAALMSGKIDLKGKKAGVILSGGNVDLDHLPWIK